MSFNELWFLGFLHSANTNTWLKHTSLQDEDTEALLLPAGSSTISKEAWEDLQIRRAKNYVSGKNTNLHVNVQVQAGSPLRGRLCRPVTGKSTLLLLRLHS